MTFIVILHLMRNLHLPGVSIHILFFFYQNRLIKECARKNLVKIPVLHSFCEMWKILRSKKKGERKSKGIKKANDQITVLGVKSLEQEGIMFMGKKQYQANIDRKIYR